jgi:hypothetical protein
MIILRRAAVIIATALTQVATTAGAAPTQDVLPIRSVPLQFGGVPKPDGPGNWLSEGAWIDENTVASVLTNFGILVIHRPDRMLLQSISNPDSNERETVPLLTAPIALGDTVLVRSHGTRGQQWANLHVFARAGKNKPFAYVKTVTLEGLPASFTSLAKARVESVSGGVQSRRIVFSWGSGTQGWAMVLTPTGEPLEWSREIVQYTLATGTISPSAIIRGSLMVIRQAPSGKQLRFMRRSSTGAWISEGIWNLPGSSNGAAMSNPVALSSDVVYVGDTDFDSIGRVHELRFDGSAWKSVATLAPQRHAAFSKWGDPLGAQDDWLIIGRRKGASGVATVESYRLSDAGVLVRGPTYIDAYNESADMSGSFARAQVTEWGTLILDASLSINEAWKYVRVPFALDLDQDGITDCDAIARGTVPDCNANQVPDAADIALAIESDEDSNGIPDACQADCDGTGGSNYAEILAGASDCNRNFVPDSCDLAQPSADLDGDGQLDVCDPDCNGNGVPDSIELLMGALEDCDGNGVADTCDRYQPLPLAGTPGSYTPTESFFVWFPVRDTAPVLSGIDIELGNQTVTQPILIAIIRDTQGTGIVGSVALAAVVHMEGLRPVVQNPPEQQGGTVASRFRFASVDLTGVPGFWVMFRGAVLRPLAQASSMSTPGNVRLANTPNMSAGSIVNQLNASTFYAIYGARVWPLGISCAGPADLNFDGMVDGADLGLLLGAWQSNWSGADLDGNGIVAGGDLGMLLADWGRGQ